MDAGQDKGKRGEISQQETGRIIVNAQRGSGSSEQSADHQEKKCPGSVM
jgi:hypothetical protein